MKDMKIRSFILGTDWWTDCDDAVAIRMLVRAHKDNRIKLLAMGINACMEHSVTSLDGFVAGHGVTDIPFGIDLAATDYGGNPRFQKNLAPRAVRYSKNEDAEDAVSLYRRVLAKAEDKVEIIEIGFSNVLAGLLESCPDEISPLSGVELVCEKVEKLWIMAGKWDEVGGREHNFCHGQRSRRAGEILCRLCPVPITFLGFEVGETVISGGGKVLSEDDMLYSVMRDHGSKDGRSSWDPMTALMALIGDEYASGYSVVRGRARVDAHSGANYFEKSEDGPHCFVVKRCEDSYYEEMINRMIK